ncbi:MAG: AgmX/PglI C-terminal domain-containing protein [Proteobacteria bacterium]|nr:AgmX/PglI C-terminal domain-containing protein [Pseudomonadota bacterium]
MNTTTTNSIDMCADRTSYKWRQNDSLDWEAVEVAVMWNGTVQDVVHRRTDGEDPWAFTIGEAPGCDFLIPADALQGETKLPLVEIRDGLVTVRILSGAGGDVIYGDGTWIPLASLYNNEKEENPNAFRGHSTYSLASHGQVVMDLKPWTFCIRSSQSLEKLSCPSELDWSSSYFFGISAILHLAFFLLVNLIPPGASGLVFDPNATDNRFIKYMLIPKEVQLSVVPEIKENIDQDQTDGKDGNRHAEIQGQSGNRNAKNTGKRYGIKGPRDNPKPQMARMPTKEMAETGGILSYLSSAAAPTSPFGREIAIGVDPENALGSLVGNQIGESFGYGGLGLTGTGRGGGGSGEGTLGIGHLGTIGTGGGRGSGSRYGRYKGGLKERLSKGPRVVSSPATIKGSLSKNVIRRIVRRHINEIKFCYEQGLRKRPDIAGRVAIKFLISRSGAVQSTAVFSSTVDDPQVESCIARTVRRMTFPQPEDGGIVIVTYPFTLTSPED